MRAFPTVLIILAGAVAAALLLVRGVRRRRAAAAYTCQICDEHNCDCHRPPGKTG